MKKLKLFLKKLKYKFIIYKYIYNNIKNNYYIIFYILNIYIYFFFS